MPLSPEEQNKLVKIGAELAREDPGFKHLMHTGWRPYRVLGPFAVLTLLGAFVNCIIGTALYRPNPVPLEAIVSNAVMGLLLGLTVWLPVPVLVYGRRLYRYTTLNKAAQQPGTSPEWAAVIALLGISTIFGAMVGLTVTKTWGFALDPQAATEARIVLIAGCTVTSFLIGLAFAVFFYRKFVFSLVRVWRARRRYERRK